MLPSWWGMERGGYGGSESFKERREEETGGGQAGQWREGRELGFPHVLLVGRGRLWYFRSSCK